MNMFTLWNEISKLEQIKVDIDCVLLWKKEMLREMQKWWFTDDVFEQKYLQDYLNDFKWNCLWYIWMDRQSSKDIYLESKWKWTKKQLAQLICSKQWKYLLEEDVITEELIEKYRKDFCSLLD